MAEVRTPTATYRLQLHGGCTFAQVGRLAFYLDELGISDLYASPLFKARRGSGHGYSVTNPLELNPELGSRAAFDALSRRLRSLDMGLLLDVVPNHMALSKSNPWWWDVLENGASSPYAIFFDIEWDPPYRVLKHRVLLPILGRPYGQCLEDQEIKLELTVEGFVVHYYEHCFPLDPKTCLPLLTHGLEELQTSLGEDSPDMIRILGVITLVRNLPPRSAPGLKKRRERLHWCEVIKKSLWLLYENYPNLRRFLDDNISRANGRRGDPASFDLLDTVLRQQAYRLACWLVSLEMINYRRFFSINDLIGIRVEDPQVFEATHNLLFKLVEDGKITGLRLDHIDGLYDPQGFLARLQSRLQGLVQTGTPFYLVVEKILEHGEDLPEPWPVAGTTGYDFLGLLNNLFVAPAGLQALEQIYVQQTRETGTWQDLVYAKKKLIMTSLFGGEVHNLAEELVALAGKDRGAMDISRQELLQALIEVSACLPVYRTYSNDYGVSPADAAYLREALAGAGERQPSLGGLALGFLGRVLLLHFHAGMPEEQKKSWLRFVCRWQQFTGPIMAKGLEDTAAYVYNPLVSLNEVGGCREAVSIPEFHAFNEVRQRVWPHTLNATSTHDTKRSEDVRARLNVLSELPELWEACLSRWRALNAPKKTLWQDQEVPDANEEIFLYQTLLGAWPLHPEEVGDFKARLQDYLVKALREAKVHTRWIEPRQDYEQKVLEFAQAILADAGDKEFLKDFLELQGRLAYYGALNSLSQVLLKITSPGVPDFYQGCELWDFSLVDPDNRRPVDFGRRQKLLKEITAAALREDAAFLPRLLSGWRDGRLKLFLTAGALGTRRTYREVFEKGEYLALSVAGSRQEHVVALARRLGQEWVMVLAPRFFAGLTEPENPPLGQAVWQDTRVIMPTGAPQAWRDAFTGAVIAPAGPEIEVAQVLARLPLALLVSTLPG